MFIFFGRPAIIREHKGKNLLELPETYVIIDLETTGLDPAYESIIEFAGMRYVDGHAAGEYSTLINPGVEIDSFITKLTGITNEMLADAPSLSDVMPQIRDFIGDSVILAHNANFDVNFLYDAYVRELDIPLTNNFVDTMRISRRLYPEEQHHRLRDLIQRFGVGDKVGHRAMADVQQTQKCYERMKAEFDAGRVTLRIPHDIRAKDIAAKTNSFREDSPVFGKTFCFTGTLKCAKRADAMQAVVDLGGHCADTVRADVDFLVIGGDGYPMQLKDGKSNKWKKAQKMKLEGAPIEVISEDVFLDMLNS